MTKDVNILKRIRKIVKRWEDDTWTDGLSYDSMSEISDLLEKSEQEPGHWSHDGSHWQNRWICSECGYKLFDEQTSFCPNCGAKMEG